MHVSRKRYCTPILHMGQRGGLARVAQRLKDRLPLGKE